MVAGRGSQDTICGSFPRAVGRIVDAGELERGALERGEPGAPSSNLAGCWWSRSRAALASRGTAWSSDVLRSSSEAALASRGTAGRETGAIVAAKGCPREPGDRMATMTALTSCKALALAVGEPTDLGVMERRVDRACPRERGAHCCSSWGHVAALRLPSPVGGATRFRRDAAPEVGRCPLQPRAHSSLPRLQSKESRCLLQPGDHAA
jgi:hypothetical protein